MAEEKPQGVPSVPTPEPDAGHIPMTEELDRAKWTLPSLRVVGVVLAGIAIVIAMVAYSARPKAGATGSIDEAYAVALPGNNVLVTIKMSLQNVGAKPLWIRSIRAKLNAQQKDFTDEAASAVDFERYFFGFPDLRDHSIAPLKVETKINPGEETRGSVIVSFPVTVDQFNARTALTVTIVPYDQRPIVITK